MIDEPDLSALAPTTVTFLRMRADDYALARLNPDPSKRYVAPLRVSALLPLLEQAGAAGDGVMEEMDDAFMLMRCLNVFARRAANPNQR